MNVGRLKKSHALEFIEFAKLDSDGRLRSYRYEYSKEEIAAIIFYLILWILSKGSKGPSVFQLQRYR